MKNSEIHNGLSKKEIRDYFAKAFIDLQKKENSLKRGNIIFEYENSEIFMFLIEKTKLEIKFQKNLLEIYEAKQAILTLINENGWNEHDVSDYTTINADQNDWMSFIGTENEYNELLKKLK